MWPLFRGLPGDLTPAAQPTYEGPTEESRGQRTDVQRLLLKLDDDNGYDYHNDGRSHFHTN